MLQLTPELRTVCVGFTNCRPQTTSVGLCHLIAVREEPDWSLAVLDPIIREPLHSYASKCGDARCSQVLMYVQGNEALRFDNAPSEGKVTSMQLECSHAHPTYGPVPPCSSELSLG